MSLIMEFDLEDLWRRQTPKQPLIYAFYMAGVAPTHVLVGITHTITWEWALNRPQTKNIDSNKKRTSKL